MSLVDSQMSSDVISEESSVYEGAGWAMMRPSVQVMSLRISHLHQGERRQPSPLTARVSVTSRRVRK